MRTKSLALLALALGCGLVASIGITQVLAKRTGDVATETGDTETIFVAMKEVAMGDVLNAQLVRLEKWPKDRIPPGALTKMEDIEGRQARFPIYPGEPILDHKLTRKGSANTPTQLIPAGYRVVAVRVDNVSGGGGLVNPRDRVDVLVYLTKNPQHDVPESMTRPVLQDIQVFAVNEVVSMGGEKESRAIKATTVSLLVTPEQASKLTLACELGQIRLSLRGPADDTQAAVATATPRDIIGGKTENGNREKENAADDTSGKPATNILDLIRAVHAKVASQKKSDNDNAVAVLPDAPPMKKNKWLMRVLRGSAVDDVELESDGTTADGTHATGFNRWTSSSNSTNLNAIKALAKPAAANGDATKSDAGDASTQPPPSRTAAQ